jgi:hypothetical protein
VVDAVPTEKHVHLVSMDKTETGTYLSITYILYHIFNSKISQDIVLLTCRGSGTGTACAAGG